jgi:two-component system chemotaxis response regulator CheB
MQGHDLIVIGASAGGVAALSALVHDLPAGLPASLFVVCHFPPGERSQLPEILSRHGHLLAVHAQHGDPIRPGQIYIAPPDYHLLVRPGQMELSHSARENRHRPAIDPLFRSAAKAYGPRVIGVILTGTRTYDGAAGLLAVRKAGGIALIEDPAHALMPPMPEVVLQIAGADHVVPLPRIGPLLAELVRRPVSDQRGTAMSDPIERMPETVYEDMSAQERGERRGRLSTFSCPDCGGTLWQVDETELTRFRCHVGHAYYGEELLAEQSEALEAALWSAVRGFREKAVLARQLAVRERQHGNREMAERFEEEGRVAENYSVLIEEHVLRDPQGNHKKTEAAPLTPPLPPEPKA